MFSSQIGIFPSSAILKIRVLHTSQIRERSERTSPPKKPKPCMYVSRPPFVPPRVLPCTYVCPPGRRGDKLSEKFLNQINFNDTAWLLTLKLSLIHVMPHYISTFDIQLFFLQKHDNGALHA